MNNKINLMTHVVAGFPSMQQVEKKVLMMASKGIKYIEIQFPFSEPVADGPILAQCNKVAVDNGVTTEQCFELIERLQNQLSDDVNLIIMTYYNIAFNYGLKQFCKRASDLGVYGIILPDLPISKESTDHFVKYCREFDLHPILLLTSTSRDARIQETVHLASGMIYCVARKGVTGVREGVADDLEVFLQRVRKYTQLPLAVGRGVSNKQQAMQVAQFADLVIIGSAAMKTYIESEYNIQVLSDYFDMICL